MSYDTASNCTIALFLQLEPHLSHPLCSKQSHVLLFVYLNSGLQTSILYGTISLVYDFISKLNIS